MHFIYVSFTSLDPIPIVYTAVDPWGKPVEGFGSIMFKGQRTGFGSSGD